MIFSIIQELNQVIEQAREEGILANWGEHLHFSPLKGNVLFGSLTQNWGFSLDRFVHVYENKFKLKEKNLKKLLWGNFSYNEETSEWEPRSKETQGKRGFVEFILEPLQSLSNAIKAKDKPAIEQGIKAFSLTFPEKKEVMLSEFMPIGNAILTSITLYIPPPSVAQRYRCEILYNGPPDDEKTQVYFFLLVFFFCYCTNLLSIRILPLKIKI